MTTISYKRSLLTITGITLSFSVLAQSPEPVPNGIEMPKNYQNWQLIGVSHRTDKNSLRAILGNGIAVTAARSGNTHPWPDGAILAKLVWKDSEHPLWPAATVPGDVEHFAESWGQVLQYSKNRLCCDLWRDHLD